LSFSLSIHLCLNLSFSIVIIVTFWFSFLALKSYLHWGHFLEFLPKVWDLWSSMHLRQKITSQLLHSCGSIGIDLQIKHSKLVNISLITSADFLSVGSIYMSDCWSLIYGSFISFIRSFICSLHTFGMKPRDGNKKLDMPDLCCISFIFSSYFKL